MSPRKKPAAHPAAAHHAHRAAGAEAVAGGPPVGADGKPYSFEGALERLESIVDDLENGTLSLEDSLARFEEGVRLTRFLETELTRAQKRVEELVESSGAPAARPWAGDEDVDDEGHVDESRVLPWDDDDETHAAD
jgi:exodeoxyribonuclease VII small subunit